MEVKKFGWINVQGIDHFFDIDSDLSRGTSDGSVHISICLKAVTDNLRYDDFRFNYPVKGATSICGECFNKIAKIKSLKLESTNHAFFKNKPINFNVNSFISSSDNIGDSLIIEVNGLLHIAIILKKLLSLRSYIDSSSENKKFMIELFFDSNSKAKLEYNSSEKWILILKEISKYFPPQI